VKALTVQQPWAWAIVHGGKLIENRTQLWGYRGPLAIHAGARISDRGMADQRVGHALRDHGHITDPGMPAGMTAMLGAPIHMSAIIGVVDLVDAHPDAACCRPWGESAYAEPDGFTRRDVVHLVLENARAVDPIPCTGRLGLWTVPADIEEALR
jgi:hypothetical protein